MLHVHVSMLHVHVSMLHVHVSMLHFRAAGVYAAFPVQKPMLQVHATCPMSMLHFNAA
jgi:hypothetical protein